MKLSKRTLLVLAAVIFIVVLVGVGRAYLQQVSERKQVNEQLALAQTRLKGIQVEPPSSKRTELETQLGQAKSQFEEAKAKLPQSLEDLAVSSTLFDLAKDYSVEVTGMTFSGTANETLGGVAWSVTSLTVKLEGDSPNLIGLVTKLNSRFATGVIKSVTITMAAPVAEPEPAPDFQLQNLNGQIISLSEFRGKPVLINFWATWCPYCVDEMPYIQQIYEEWSDKGLVVLAINANESPALVKEFLQTYKLSLPVLLDTDNNVGQGKYGVRVIPTTFFIDRDGIIQDMFGFFTSKEAIEEHLDKIILYSETPSGQEASAEIQMAIYTYQGG